MKFDIIKYLEKNEMPANDTTPRPMLMYVPSVEDQTKIIPLLTVNGLTINSLDQIKTEILYKYKKQRNINVAYKVKEQRLAQNRVQRPRPITRVKGLIKNIEKTFEKKQKVARQKFEQKQKQNEEKVDKKWREFLQAKFDKTKFNKKPTRRVRTNAVNNNLNQQHRTGNNIA